MALYTLPSYTAFNDDLIHGFMDRYGHDPLRVARARIYVPTMRAKHALLEAFEKVSEAHALLLPQIFAFGELKGSVHNKVMPSLKRQLLLAQLIADESPSFGALDFSKSLALSQSLLTLFDECAIENINPLKIAELYIFDEAQHHMHIQKLLEAVALKWPALVEKSGYVSPVDDHHACMDAEMHVLKTQYKDDVVIVAGTTGSQKKTAEFMAFVNTLPFGSVVLPGYDHTLNATHYQQFLDEPSHPFYGFSKLFDTIGFAHENVSLWHESAVSDVLKKRFDLVLTSLTPSLKKRPFEPGNFHLIEAENTQEEADVLAVMLKDILENSDQTAVVVTPDRDLVRRLSASLKRFGILIDDSSGVPLKETPHGVFLRLMLKMFLEDFKPLSVLAFLKHGFAKSFFDLKAFEFYVRENDQNKSLDHLLLNDDFKDQPFYEGVKHFYGLCLDLKAMLLKKQMPFDEGFRLVLKTLNLLHENEEKCVIFEGFCEDLLILDHSFLTIAGHDMADVLLSLMGGYVVRETSGCHPRIALWGPLEARMQKADVMLLAGLNDGVWPSDNKGHFLLSPLMRQNIGLSNEDRRIGLSAHDFMQGFCAKTVYLTRSLKKGGSPTLPSRFWVKMMYALKTLGVSIKDLAPSKPFEAYARLLFTPKEMTPSKAPEPNPDLEVRPRLLPVTAIEHFLRDPYSIYAKYILRLRPLPLLDMNRDAQVVGTLMHSLLEEVYKNQHSFEDLRKIAEENLLNYSFTYSQKMYFLRRFDFILKALKGLKQKAPLKIFCEYEGRVPFLKGDFHLYGRADRLDFYDDRLEIIDYKTGQPPSKRDVDEGFANQLVLLALIAQKGGFKNIESQAFDLAYWHLKGKSESDAIEITSLKKTENLMDEAEEGLAHLMKTYLYEKTPYYAVPKHHKAPRFHDYAHLERLEEWMSFDDE